MIILFKKAFFGVSQSDFIIQKIFIWTKTQKRNLKLNWQPLTIVQSISYNLQIDTIISCKRKIYLILKANRTLK